MAVPTRRKPRLSQRSEGGGAGEGAPIDIYGAAAYDPTANVIALVESLAESTRELRDADLRFNAAQHQHLIEVGKLRAEHAETLRTSDLDRLAKTREVDVLAGAASAQALATAVSTLATTSDRNAETLRTQLTATAATMAKQTTDQAQVLSIQFDNVVKDINARVAELQKAQYQGAAKDPMVADLVMRVEKLTNIIAEGAGKQAVVDPQIAEMRADQKLLLAAMTAGVGQGQGQKSMVGYISIGISILLGLLVLADRFGK